MDGGGGTDVRLCSSWIPNNSHRRATPQTVMAANIRIFRFDVRVGLPIRFWCANDSRLASPLPLLTPPGSLLLLSVAWPVHSLGPVLISKPKRYAFASLALGLSACLPPCTSCSGQPPLSSRVRVKLRGEGYLFSFKECGLGGGWGWGNRCPPVQLLDSQ